MKDPGRHKISIYERQYKSDEWAIRHYSKQYLLNVAR